MSQKIAQMWSQLTGLVVEDQVLANARLRAQTLNSSGITSTAGTTLSTLAASHRAENIVEVGASAGITGLYLMRGSQGVGLNPTLTTIDADANQIQSARQTFAEAGFSSSQTRVIDGNPDRVLPRIQDTAYDMVFIRTNAYNFGEYFIEAHRIIKSGGLIIVSDILKNSAGTVQDFSVEDNMVYEFISDVMLNPNLISSTIPVENGMLLSVKK